MQFISVTKRPKTEKDSYRDIDINIEHIVSLEWFWIPEDRDGLCGEYSKIGLSNGSFVYVEEDTADISEMMEYLQKNPETMFVCKSDIYDRR